MQTVNDMMKIREIMSHISKLFDYYGEDDSFFDEYIEKAITHDPERALHCFRELVAQLPQRKGSQHEKQKSVLEKKRSTQTKASRLCPLKQQKQTALFGIAT